MPHTKQVHTHIYVYVCVHLLCVCVCVCVCVEREVCEHKNFQRAHLSIYITTETASSHFLPKNMNLSAFLNPRQQKIHISYTWIFIHHFALYMHTCITCKHVWTCACDCSGSLIMALQGLKCGSFNNNYWELPTDSVFCWLIYRK